MKNVPNIEELKKEIEKIKNEYVTALNALLKQYIVDTLDTYAVELKEQNIPKIHSVELIFEDEYDDEGGTNAYLQEIFFFDKQKNRISLDVTIETGNPYKTDLLEVLREVVEDNMSIDELAKEMDDLITIELND